MPAASSYTVPARSNTYHATPHELLHALSCETVQAMIMPRLRLNETVPMYSSMSTSGTMRKFLTRLDYPGDITDGSQRL